VEDPAMDMHFINGQPITQFIQQQQQQQQAILNSVKELHRELVKVVQKSV